MKEESVFPLTNGNLMSDFFPELTSQGQCHQQEYPHNFDDVVSTKDDNWHASDDNEPQYEQLFSTQQLIDKTETTTNKYVTLDHGETQIVDDEDNDDNTNYDDDEAFSNNIVASCRNRKGE